MVYINCLVFDDYFSEVSNDIIIVVLVAQIAQSATNLKMSVYTPSTIINHKSSQLRPFPGSLWEGYNVYSTIYWLYANVSMPYLNLSKNLVYTYIFPEKSNNYVFSFISWHSYCIQLENEGSLAMAHITF